MPHVDRQIMVRAGRNVGLAALAGSVLVAGGCAAIPNKFVKDSPSYNMVLASPTSLDVRASHARADQRYRDWELATTASEPVMVIHGPLYFEDPVSDQGASYRNRYGWEDFAAVPYSLGRSALNLAALPVSMVVTPPWTPMVSDGLLSEQALGYDHDAARLSDVERPYTVGSPGKPVEPEVGGDVAPPEMNGGAAADEMAAVDSDATENK